MVIFASLLVMILVSSSRTTYKLSASHALVPQPRGGYGLAAAEQRTVTLAPRSEHESAATDAPPDRDCHWPRRPAWARHWSRPPAHNPADGNGSD